MTVVCCTVNSGEHVLGYERGAIYGKSWYEMIHPDDVAEASFKHVDCKLPPRSSLLRFLKLSDTHVREFCQSLFRNLHRRQFVNIGYNVLLYRQIFCVLLQ